MQVNCLLISPNMLVKLCKSPAVRKYDISSLKFAIVGGTMLKKETQISVMERFPDLQIYHAYGAYPKFRKYKKTWKFIYFDINLVFIIGQLNLKLGIL